MKEYIERDDGKIAAWQILEGMGYSSKHNDRLVEEIDAVFDDISAADVRPVVLCRDCVHRYVRDWPSCQGRRGDFFCADGEKKEKN